MNSASVLLSMYPNEIITRTPCICISSNKAACKKSFFKPWSPPFSDPNPHHVTLLPRIHAQTTKKVAATSNWRANQHLIASTSRQMRNVNLGHGLMATTARTLDWYTADALGRSAVVDAFGRSPASMPPASTAAAVSPPPR